MSKSKIYSLVSNNIRYILLAKKGACHHQSCLAHTDAPSLFISALFKKNLPTEQKPISVMNENNSSSNKLSQ